MVGRNIPPAPPGPMIFQESKRGAEPRLAAHRTIAARKGKSLRIIPGDSVFEARHRWLDMEPQLFHAASVHFAELVMDIALVQIDLRDGGAAALPRLRKDLAIRVDDVGGVIVTGGDQKHLVLDGPRFAQSLIAAPARHQDLFSTLRR